MTRLFRQESDRDVSFHFKLSDLTRPVRLCLPRQEREWVVQQERERVEKRRSIDSIDSISHRVGGYCAAAVVFTCVPSQCQLPRNWEQRQRVKEKREWGSRENERERPHPSYPTQDWEDVNVCDGSPLVNTQPRRAGESASELWCCVQHK
jgi:hypothetical protein